MEVGAVKQAFNNEIILLKKNLNQAKIQTIHKLTRKAKTFMEKKLPEPQKVKLKRKAESAVKEVLIIKKIKTRDIARFIVTHSGNLNDFLNKPVVDNDKACARLLLHKALQDKYKHIREKFSDISIKDLFMSRQERRKLKQEAREKQNNKKKGKHKKDKLDAVNVEGEWDVEMTEDKNSTPGDNNTNLDSENDKLDDEIEDNFEESENDNESESEQSGSESETFKRKVENNVMIKPKTNGSDIESTEESNDIDLPNKFENINSNKQISNNGDSNELETITGKAKSTKINNDSHKFAVNKKDLINKKLDKKASSNKNKNLKNKLEKRNFHKETTETPNVVTKMVDPFFITSSGDNYISLVEPRQPDEVKETHKQGNRQYRRAVMFGHAPKVKPKSNYVPRNNNFNNRNNKEVGNKKFNQNNNKIDNKESFHRKTDRGNSIQDLVPEKLHPSWEAKKKQSGILPFQGKKIVFDES